MSPAYRCPQCGAVLPGGSPQAPCPACLMQLGLTAGHDTPVEFDGQIPELGPTHVPTPDRLRAAVASKLPQPAELAGLFPELEILKLLGHGGMGAVYQARQTGLDRYVALKIIVPEVAGESGFAERFIREARVLARLNHPHIVTIHDFGQRSGLHYLIMEYVDGVNLREVLRTGRMAPAEALRIIPPVCEALQYAHDEGVVHRDIKPENILVDRKGRVKIADFGLARLAGRDSDDLNLTGTRQVVGTPRYMAPEQMQGARAVDHRVDLYALGVVFYEMLTGEVPMGRFAPPSHHVPLDRRLDEVVLRALESDPNRRYQHASDIKTDVETISRNESAATWPTPLVDEIPTNDLTWPAIFLLILGGIQIAGGLVVFTLSLAEQSSETKVVLLILMGIAALAVGAGCMAVAASIRFFLSSSTNWLRWGAVALMLPTSLAWFLGLPVGIWTLRILSRQRSENASVRRSPRSIRPQDEADFERPPELTAAAISLLMIACLQVLAPVVFYFLIIRDGSTTTPARLMAFPAIFSVLTGGIAILGATSFLAGASVGWLRGAALALMFPCSLTWILGFPAGLWTLRILWGLPSTRRTYALRNDGPWSPATAPVSPRPREVTRPQTEPGSEQLSSPWSGLEWAQKAVRRMSSRQKMSLGLVCGALLVAGLLAYKFSPMGNLHQAARSGSSLQVAAQLLLGADIDRRDERGMTPLMWAAWERHPEIVRQLLDRGADPNQKGDDGETALMKAAFRGNLPIVTALLQRKASVNESDDDGETALLLAAAEGHVSIVQVLRGYNADPRAATHGGWTPLIAAAVKGHSPVVNLLIPISDVNATDRHGETALMKAAATGRLSDVHALLQRRAEPNLKSIAGATAVTFAIAGGHAAVVDALIKTSHPQSDLLFCWQGYRAGRAGDYVSALAKLKEAAAISPATPGPWKLSLDEWHQEIVEPSVFLLLLTADCEQRLGNKEGAKVALQKANASIKPGVTELLLLRRVLDRPERHVSERWTVTTSEISQHVAEPERAWHLIRGYEEETRSPGHTMGSSGQDTVERKSLFQ